MNLVLGNVEETITTVGQDLQVGKEVKNYEMLFVRGDGVILLAPIKS